MNPEQTMAMNAGHHQVDMCVPSLSIGQLSDANMFADTLNTNSLLHFQTQQNQLNNQELLNRNEQDNLIDDENYHIPTTTAATTANNQFNNNAPVPSYDDIFPALPESETKPIKEVVHVDPWSSKMRMRSSNVTQVFQISFEERRYRENNSMSSATNAAPFAGVDNTSRICSEIMRDTCTKIETSCSKDGTITFLITGKEEDVMKAKRRISSELKVQSCVTLHIPKKYHKFILGKNYRRLQEIQKMTNAHIQIPAQNSDSEEVKISGSKDSIDRAIHALQSISNEAASRSTDKIQVPKLYHPFLLGPFNETLQEISETTGAKINIPPANIQSDEIMIAGETEAVERAKKRLLEIYAEKQKRCQQVYIEIKKSLHRFIIGKGRQTIQEIFKKTGVSIEMPPQDSPSETITLTGDQDKLGIAVSELFEKAHSGVEEEVNVERWIQKRILGPKGSKLQELANYCPSLRVARFLLDEDKIKFQGAREDVEKACEVLTKEINRIRQEIVVKDIPVLIKYHRHIIGKQGVIIKQIRDETGVQIHVPSESEQSTQNSHKDACDNIRLEGSPEGVERAYVALKTRIDLLEKKENEYTRELLVDQRFHKQIIGVKGEKIREIRDRFNQVAINIPDSGSKSDKVTIRGAKEDVEECYKFLAQFNKELLANNFITEVPISKEICKFINNNSATIKKIRDETSTKLDFPVYSENQKSANVTISGKKENVEKAKQKLLDLLRGLGNYIEIDIMIDSKYHGALKRRRQTIKDECGADVTINFPQEGTKSEKVAIWGPKDSAMKAKKKLFELSNDLKENDYIDELKVNQRHRRDLQIRYKQDLYEIGERNRVTVKFIDSQDENEDAISIKGRNENVNNAREECIQLIKVLESVETKVINIPNASYQKYNLKQFFSRKRSEEKIGNVMLKFQAKPEEQIEQIILRGPRDIVAKGEAYINDTLATMTSLECDIDRKYHRSIMGRNWSRVNRIQHDYDVHIKFPEREPMNANGLPFNHAITGTGGDIDLNGNSNVSSSPAAEEEHSSVLSDSDKSDKQSLIKHENMITIYGKQSNCLAAKDALYALIPIEYEMEVPFDYHRYIIGQKGKDVREIMNKFEVEINVPQVKEHSDMIKIIGLKENIDEAKSFIQEKVAKLDEEKEERLAKSFRLELRIDPQYHRKIIGRKGSNINSLRTKYGVNVQFPEKHDSNHDQQADDNYENHKDDDLIAIVGYEDKANAAAQEIKKLVQELADKVTEDIDVDSRVHSRLIGTKGKNIRKMMEDFKVEIKFPRASDPNPNLVSITGNPEDVAKAKEHIFDLTEEYMESVPERPAEHTLSSLVSLNDERSPSSSETSGRGFQVHGGPWEQGKGQERKAPEQIDTTDTEQFPSMSGDALGDQSKVRWGPIPKLPSSNANYQTNFS